MTVTIRCGLSFGATMGTTPQPWPVAKKDKPKQPRKIKESPRFIARGLGYSSSKFVGDGAGARNHWVTQEPEAVPESWQDAESKRARHLELERKDEERKTRIQDERKIADAGGQAAVRKAKRKGGITRRYHRELVLAKQGFQSYPEYLRSPRWADVKRRYGADLGRPQDCICGETEGLQLHHLTYERVGSEDLSDLTPLCRNCHAMIHTLVERGELGLDLTGFISERRAADYAAEVRPPEPSDREIAQTVADRAGLDLGVVQRRLRKLGVLGGG